MDVEIAGADRIDECSGGVTAAACVCTGNTRLQKLVHSGGVASLFALKALKSPPFLFAQKLSLNGFNMFLHIFTRRGQGNMFSRRHFTDLHSGEEN